MTRVLEEPSEKQLAFLKAGTRFVAYGGARGGGKSWAVRRKAMLLAVGNPGIRILILRRTFPELRENHILPLQQELQGVARYKETEKAFLFPGGSRIRFGYCDGESDVLQYQGQEYDVIFIDEATQFSEFQFNTLTACVRGANSFPKRVYLTCNPGGVGHEWVKRLFIDRQYRGGERAEDYTFIPARVYDNRALVESDPGYVDMLRNLPEDLRRAWLDGDWNVFAGQYFKEFREDVHVCEPFALPRHWRRYITLDYGLDMLACYWIAVDENMHAYVYKELYEGRDNGGTEHIISSAAQAILERTGDEKITATLAPPDLWNRRQETGKSAADIFWENGVHLTKTSNDRVAGWLAVKEWLKVGADEQRRPTGTNRAEERILVQGRPTRGEDVPAGASARRQGSPAIKPRLQIFRNCHNLIRTLPRLQFDPNNPNDVANQPHELTHAPDALRGFCVYWTQAAKAPDGRQTVYNFAWEKPRPSALGKGEQVEVI